MNKIGGYQEFGFPFCREKSYPKKFWEVNDHILLAGDCVVTAWSERWAVAMVADIAVCLAEVGDKVGLD